MNIDTTALDTLFDANPDTAKGIATAYQTLLGGVPTQAGFTFLINNAVMTNFGAGPGPVFNAENIFINLANSLIQGNTTAAANFATISAGATLTDMVTSLYNAIIPEADSTAEGLAFVTRPEALQFYQTAAGERGVAGDQGAAIVALASLLQIAVRDDIGVGADVNDLIAAVNEGSSQLPATGETLTDIDVADGTNFDRVVPEPEPEPEPQPQPQPQPQPNPTPPNVAPTTSPVTLVAIAEDSGARQITQAELLANVVDPDGPNLVATNLAIQTGNGVLTNNNNGTWTYTPSLNDDTQVLFSYQISDGVAAPVATTADLDITPELESFTANKDGFDTINVADSIEGNAASGENDTINATVIQIAGATIQGLGGTDTLNISGAGAADLTAVTTLDTIDTLKLLHANASLRIDATKDTDNFGALVGVGANDLIIASGASTNLASFEGFDMVDATGLVDDDVLTIADTATGTNYTVNLGDSDLAAGASTSTDSITVVQDNPGATQSIVTGAGNDEIMATGATVLTVDAGAGNDTVTLEGSVTNLDTIVGGDGIDTLNISDSALDPNFKDRYLEKIDSIEIINFDFSHFEHNVDSIYLNNSNVNSDININVTNSNSTTALDATNVSSRKLTYNGSDNIDVVIGTQAGDIIDLGAGDDRISGTLGSDRITFGPGKDRYFANTDSENTFLDGIDTFVDFGLGLDDQIYLNLSNAGQIRTNNDIGSLIADDAGGLAILQNEQSDEQISTSTSAGSVANTVIAVLNSTPKQKQTELWFDTDWNDTANRQHFLTIENVDTIGALQNFSANNGVDFIIA